MGTVKELFNPQGDLVWKNNNSLWGKPNKHIESNDPTTTINCNLGFQGQYFDQETGLHYNYHRYYDADMGQYMSPDPIGLLGGLHPQAYVHNPNGWVDPLGLNPCKKATDMLVIKPTTKAWNEAVENIKNGKGHGQNYRVTNQKDAKRLLDEAKPNTMHSKPHARGKKKTKYRHEYHRNKNEGYMEATELDHNLEHIKWADYRNKKADGHIFYDKWI